MKKLALSVAADKARAEGNQDFLYWRGEVAEVAELKVCRKILLSEEYGWLLLGLYGHWPLGLRFSATTPNRISRRAGQQGSTAISLHLYRRW